MVHRPRDRTINLTIPNKTLFSGYPGTFFSSAAREVTVALCQSLEPPECSEEVLASLVDPGKEGMNYLPQSHTTTPGTLNAHMAKDNGMVAPVEFLELPASDVL